MLFYCYCLCYHQSFQLEPWFLVLQLCWAFLCAFCVSSVCFYIPFSASLLSHLNYPNMSVNLQVTPQFLSSSCNYQLPPITFSLCLIFFQLPALSPRIVSVLESNLRSFLTTQHLMVTQEFFPAGGLSDLKQPLMSCSGSWDMTIMWDTALTKTF